MSKARPFKTHEEYFAAQPVAVRRLLERVQQEVERQVPGSPRFGYSHVYGAPGLSGVAILERE